MRILLIRHGETAAQKQKRYQGVTDAPLCDEGRAKLSPSPQLLEKVFVSPLLRTRQTAQILFPGAKQIVVQDLREMDLGVFENRTWEEMKDDPDYKKWVDGMCLGQCPGGESKDIFCARVCAAFDELVTQAIGRKETSVVIVAHGGTQMAVMERFCEEHRPYYEWQLACGQGYLLETSGWESEKRLQVRRICSFTKD